MAGEHPATSQRGAPHDQIDASLILHTRSRAIALTGSTTAKQQHVLTGPSHDLPVVHVVLTKARSGRHPPSSATQGPRRGQDQPDGGSTDLHNGKLLRRACEVKRAVCPALCRYGKVLRMHYAVRRAGRAEISFMGGAEELFDFRGVQVLARMSTSPFLQSVIDRSRRFSVTARPSWLYRPMRLLPH